MERGDQFPFSLASSGEFSQEGVLSGYPSPPQVVAGWPGRMLYKLGDLFRPHQEDLVEEGEGDWAEDEADEVKTGQKECACKCHSEERLMPVEEGEEAGLEGGEAGRDGLD